jgi:hypothetical protein
MLPKQGPKQGRTINKCPLVEIFGNALQTSQDALCNTDYNATISVITGLMGKLSQCLYNGNNQ